MLQKDKTNVPCSSAAMQIMALSVSWLLISNAGAQSDYELHPDLTMRLFAKEPDIVDPVALTFDADGKMYVVEMRDYPLGMDGQGRKGGTIRLLEDEDADGVIDSSSVFAEGLSFPTSIVPWNKGVIVSAPPEIIFLKDTDGDRKADVKEVLFEGFVLGVTDSNVNGLRWGLDNRVHGLNGGNGGKIRSPRQPSKVLSIENLDFVFDPSTRTIQPSYHTSAGFGLVFDDWGRGFTTYNINHIQHRVIAARYFHRNPHMPVTPATVSISDHEDMARIYPISRPETRVNHPEQAGYFSSGGGMGYLPPELYPGELGGSVLVCDVVGNLVHRDVIRTHGASFLASRSANEPRREFFASRDPAFRPVGLELGPDGALYLIDMQRDVIEHPDYIPDKVKGKLDLRAGQDRGRIYRLTPRGGLPVVKPELSKANATELVYHLANSNRWWRSTAQRLLVERGDRSCVRALREMARSHQNPRARLHAFWTLQGLNALDRKSLLAGLADTQPELREQALVLAETHASSGEVMRRVSELTADPTPRVRMQAALSTGFMGAGGKSLNNLLASDYQDRWIRTAVFTALTRDVEEVLIAQLQQSAFSLGVDSEKQQLAKELSDFAGATISKSDPLSKVIKAATSNALPETVQTAVLRGLADGLKRNSRTPAIGSKIEVLLEQVARSNHLLEAAWSLRRRLGLQDSAFFTEALRRSVLDASNVNLPGPVRLAAARTLKFATFLQMAPAIQSMLQGDAPPALQELAFDLLQPLPDPGGSKLVIQAWSQLSPSARSRAIALLLARRTFHPMLLDAIEQGKISLGELNLDLEQRRALIRESTPEVHARAKKLIGDEEYFNRKTLVEEWLGKIPAAGNPSAGKLVFEKNCLQCHAINGVGNQVGPDLGSLQSRSVEDLLSNILDPNLAINPRYATYNVELKTGETVSGILKGSTGAAIEIIQSGGKTITISKADTKTFGASKLSLMPEGVENLLSPTNLRDLIAFLQEGAETNR